MKETDAAKSPCPGCGAEFHHLDGPTHRYLGASPGCWNLYGRMLAGLYPAVPGHWSQSMVDAYAAQHPGVDGPQARQSVAIHTVALHARIAEGIDIGALNAIRVAGAEWGRANRFEWLEPIPTWSITILDVVGAADEEERGAVMDHYVEDVHAAWMRQAGSIIQEWHRAVRASMRRA